MQGFQGGLKRDELGWQVYRLGHGTLRIAESLVDFFYLGHGFRVKLVEDMLGHSSSELLVPLLLLQLTKVGQFTFQPLDQLALHFCTVVLSVFDALLEVDDALMQNKRI